MNRVYSDTLGTCQGIEIESPQKGEVCPVCGGSISKRFLPDLEDFIEERLYQGRDVRIVSPATIECHFCHFYDEDEDTTVQEPHLLTTLVQARFDQGRKCIAFDILEIRPTKH